VRHLLGDDGEAVGQHLLTDTAGFFSHECVTISSYESGACLYDEICSCEDMT
jgi:hypothetical protein